MVQESNESWIIEKVEEKGKVGYIGRRAKGDNEVGIGYMITMHPRIGYFCRKFPNGYLISRTESYIDTQKSKEIKFLTEGGLEKAMEECKGSLVQELKGKKFKVLVPV